MNINRKEVRHVLTLATPVAVGGSGTGNYNDLTNKPSINNVELRGNLTLQDLGIPIYELPPASVNSLGGVIIGDGLEIDENGVVHTVYNPEVGIQWSDITDTPTTLEGYGITDGVTKDELEEVIASISRVYRYRGTVAAVDDLQNVENPQNGDIYHVEETGTDYCWNEEESQWENLGNFLHIESLTNEEIDTIISSVEGGE